MGAKDLILEKGSLNTPSKHVVHGEVTPVPQEQRADEEIACTRAKGRTHRFFILNFFIQEVGTPPGNRMTGGKKRKRGRRTEWLTEGPQREPRPRFIRVGDFKDRGPEDVVLTHQPHGENTDGDSAVLLHVEGEGDKQKSVRSPRAIRGGHSIKKRELHATETPMNTMFGNRYRITARNTKKGTTLPRMLLLQLLVLPRMTMKDTAENMKHRKERISKMEVLRFTMLEARTLRFCVVGQIPRERLDG